VVPKAEGRREERVERKSAKDTATPVMQNEVRLHGERECACPSGDFLLHVVDLGDFATGDLCLEVLELVGLLGQLALHVLADLDAGVNVICDADEVLLAHATARHGRCSDTDAHWCEGGFVGRGGVLVAGNVHLFEDGFDAGAVQGLGLEVEEDHVVVCSAGDEGVAQGLEFVLECFGVLDDLALVLLELWCLRLLEGDCEGCDGVVVGSALVAGEDGEVNRSFQVVQSLLSGLCVGLSDALAEEDHGSSGATEGLVGGGGDDIGVWEGRWNHTGSNETRDVCHVDHQVAADLVTDFAELGVVEVSAVCRGAGHDDLGTVHESILLQPLVVDETSLD
jgi:hypothetical protein